MQICALLTRIQCKVSDAQVTVKAFGPLISDYYLKFPTFNLSTPPPTHTHQSDASA